MSNFDLMLNLSRGINIDSKGRTFPIRPEIEQYLPRKRNGSTPYKVCIVSTLGLSGLIMKQDKLHKMVTGPQANSETSSKHIANVQTNISSHHGKVETPRVELCMSRPRTYGPVYHTAEFHMYDKSEILHLKDNASRTDGQRRGRPLQTGDARSEPPLGPDCKTSFSTIQEAGSDTGVMTFESVPGGQ